MATPKVERLVNLTIALLEARRPLSFAEIRRRTRFYDHDDPESARRMFERDKDDLRRLGVPVEVRDLTFEDEPGYVVPRRAYELPDIDLTPEEVAALSLAVSMTGGEATRLAWARLAARAPDPAALSQAPPVRVRLEVDPVDAIADAIVRRRHLRFSYRTARGDITDREVAPYAIAQRRGAWYLVALDLARVDTRTFRLERIVDGPTAHGPEGAFEPPDDIDLDQAVSLPSVDAVTAELAVRPTARWAVESRGATITGDIGDGWLATRVDGIDPIRDHAWLLSLAPQVVVLAPTDIREHVRRDLEAVVAAQADAR